MTTQGPTHYVPQLPTATYDSYLAAYQAKHAPKPPATHAHTLRDLIREARERLTMADVFEGNPYWDSLYPTKAEDRR